MNTKQTVTEKEIRELICAIQCRTSKSGLVQDLQRDIDRASRNLMLVNTLPFPEKISYNITHHEIDQLVEAAINHS